MVPAILAAILLVSGMAPPQAQLPDKGALNLHRMRAQERALAPPETRTGTQGTAAAQPSPAPAEAPPPAPSSGADWPWIASCEWNENPAAGPTGWATTTTGNGYYTALQFSRTTFLAYGGTQAELDRMDSGGPPPSVERIIAIGENVLAAQGPGAWPNCFRYA